MYEVGDKVWAKNGYNVYKGKIVAKFSDSSYVVKIFMGTSVYYEDELAKRGDKE